jgi:hypothetical protein
VCGLRRKRAETLLVISAEVASLSVEGYSKLLGYSKKKNKIYQVGGWVIEKKKSQLKKKKKAVLSLNFQFPTV